MGKADGTGIFSALFYSTTDLSGSTMEGLAKEILFLSIGMKVICEEKEYRDQYLPYHLLLLAEKIHCMHSG